MTVEPAFLRQLEAYRSGDESAGRMTFVGDSSKVPPGLCEAPAVLSVVAAGVSGASVEAPTAPDFACVSVIDQSCSLGWCPALKLSILRRGFDVVRLVRVAGDGHEGHAIRQIHQLDPHCVPVARPSYRLHRSTDNTTVGGDGE